MGEVKLLLGDCLDKLKELEDNSVDSVVTDPPYEIGFMGKGWDDSGIANNPELWKEVLRVLKPGGHLLSFSHSRTYHRQAVAVEDAGFEIRDQIMWIYGSGFPKSHNIGKAVDKLNGIEIEKGDKFNVVGGTNASNGGSKFRSDHPDYVKYEAHNEWEGWGTALKPAHEPIVMARKPFKSSVAENVLEWGTGGINVDGCRIGNEVRTTPIHSTDVKEDNTLFGLHPTIQHERVETTEGRFPANIIFDEEAGKILDKQSGITKGSGKPTITKAGLGGGILGQYDGRKTMPTAKDIEMVRNVGDSGGASRFFYCPKASKKDRNEGCDGLPQKANVFMSPDSRMDKEHYERTSPGMERFKTEPKSNYHPTVKPTDLCAYLIRLVTPKGGVVLDPFMGSGSMGKAAVREGMNFIGIEREEDYMEIAKSRIEYEESKNKHQQFWT
jgi:site-specific DNA-methyltransferase (adenine-specific)